MDKRKTFYFLLLFLLLSCLFGFFIFHKLHWPTEDLGRHLLNGKLILQGNYGVLYKNVYSYTNTEFPFLNHHWFAGVVYYMIFSEFSFPGLYILNALLLLTTLLITLKRMWLRSSLFWVALLGFPLVLLLSSRIVIRPESFGYLFLTLYLLIIERYEHTGKIDLKSILCMLIIQAIWVNVHISFVMGIFVALTLFTKLVFSRIVRKSLQLRKKIVLLNIGLLSASLLNPNGINGLLYPFAMFSNYGYSIVENQSPWFLRTLLLEPAIQLYFVFAFMTTISLVAHYRNISSNETLRIVVALILSWTALRHLPFFAIICFPFIAESLHGMSRNIVRYGENLLESVRVFGTSLLVMLYLLGIPYVFSGTYNPKFTMEQLDWNIDETQFNSARFFRSLNIKGNMFNNFDIGGYLDYALYPDWKVFIDNRPDAFPASFFTDVYIPMQQNENEWKEQVKKHDFQTIYWGHTDITPWGIEFLRARLKDNEWKMVFADQSAVILLRNNEQNKEVIKNFQRDPSDLGKFNPYF